MIDQCWVHFNSGLYLGAAQHATCDVTVKECYFGFEVVMTRKEPLLALLEKMALWKKPSCLHLVGMSNFVSNMAKLVFFFFLLMTWHFTSGGDYCFSFPGLLAMQ